MKIYKVAKITTEDCVSWLIQNKFPNSQPSEWKRRSKKNIRGRIVRVFENIQNGTTMEVDESNGTIVEARQVGKLTSSIPNPVSDKPQSTIPKSKIVYGWATKRTPSSEEDLDGYLSLAPRDDYSSDNFDQEDDEIISKILMDNDFMPADETHIEIPRGRKAQLQTLLTTNPQLMSLMQYDNAYQKFLSGYEGTYEFEYDKPLK